MSFCPAPWKSIAVKNDGKIKPCCAYRGSFGDAHTDTLEDVWHSDKMKNLRQAFINGEKPKECHICWDMEKASNNSRRLQLIERVSEVTDKRLDPEFKPEHFDVNFSNICNLKCVMCDGMTSSSWIPDEKKLNLTFRDNTNCIITDFSYEDFNIPLDNLARIDFRGGEPFMSEKHFEFLEKLIIENRAKDITLGYISNGTKRPEECKMLFPHFKNIVLNVSFESTGPLYQYIRGWHHDFSEVKETVEFFNKFENLWGGFICCFQVYNLFEFVKNHEFIDSMKHTRFHNRDFYDLVIDPAYISYKAVPYELREVVIEQMKKSGYPTLNRLISTLELKDYSEELNKQFIEYTDRLDYIRNTRVIELEPRLGVMWNYNV